MWLKPQKQNRQQNQICKPQMMELSDSDLKNYDNENKAYQNLWDVAT